jgi:hypothetical protein
MKRSCFRLIANVRDGFSKARLFTPGSPRRIIGNDKEADKVFSTLAQTYCRESL